MKKLQKIIDSKGPWTPYEQSVINYAIIGLVSGLEPMLRQLLSDRNKKLDATSSR